LRPTSERKKERDGRGRKGREGKWRGNRYITYF